MILMSCTCCDMYRASCLSTYVSVPHGRLTLSLTPCNPRQQVGSGARDHRDGAQLASGPVVGSRDLYSLRITLLHVSVVQNARIGACRRYTVGGETFLPTERLAHGKQIVGVTLWSLGVILDPAS